MKMKTLVGVKRLAFLLPESASLEQKRQVIRKLRDTITNKYNVSFAEIESDDKWLQTIIAISMVSNNEELIKSAFLQISNMIETIVKVRVFNEADDIFTFENESGSAWIPE